MRELAEEETREAAASLDSLRYLTAIAAAIPGAGVVGDRPAPLTGPPRKTTRAALSRGLGLA